MESDSKIHATLQLDVQKLAERIATRVVELQYGNYTNSVLPFPKYLTRRQAADILGVTTKTVGRWIQDGRLHCARPGAAECIAQEDLTNVYVEKFRL